MSTQDILNIFLESGALLEGHFLLTSGKHSPQYFQCARVLQYPWHTEFLCGRIAEEFRDDGIDVVISPALGGIVVGQEVGRQLKVRTMFAERSEGVLTLRRGFELDHGERVLVCEDVITTGGSVQEVMEIVTAAGGIIAGAACIVDRSGGKVTFDCPRQFSLITLNVVAYEPKSCPLCQAGSVPVKPGSRETVP